MFYTESLADLLSSQNCVVVSTSTGERSRILEVEDICGVKEVCVEKLLASCIASCVQAFYRFYKIAQCRGTLFFHYIT